jgi:hypothetical protein
VAEDKVEQQPRNTTQDGSTLTDKADGWFALRIGKQLMKETMEQHLNIMATCNVIGT